MSIIAEKFNEYIYEQFLEGSQEVAEIAIGAVYITATAVGRTATAVGRTAFTAFNTLNRIKSDANAFGKFLSLTSIGLEVAQQKTGVNYGTAVRIFGTVGAVYDAFQITGTIHAFKNEIFKPDGYFFNYSPLDFLTETSFGVANFGEAVLWADSKNLIDLGRFTYKSIGGISLESFSLVGAVTVGAFAGFLGMTISSGIKLSQYKNMENAAIKSELASLAWTVTEVALIAIPLAGFAPAAPVIMGAKVFAKSAAIISFLYK